MASNRPGDRRSVPAMPKFQTLAWMAIVAGGVVFAWDRYTRNNPGR